MQRHYADPEHKVDGRVRSFLANGAAALIFGPLGAMTNQIRPNGGGGPTRARPGMFISGAGWVDFDPANGIVGPGGVIRAASVRDTQQVTPLAGGWFGFPADSLGITVSLHAELRHRGHAACRPGANRLGLKRAGDAHAMEAGPNADPRRI